MLRVAKYHGCGNDFVIVKQEDMVEYESGPEALAISVCDRKTGIGADGLIVARSKPPEMSIFNSDGSQAPMCGNGIRCFAHFLRDEGLWMDSEYDVSTLAGTMGIRVISADPFHVEVCLGRPDAKRLSESVCDRAQDECAEDCFVKHIVLDIPFPGGGMGNEAMNVLRIPMDCVFLGTMHAVLWLEAELLSDFPCLVAEDVCSGGTRIWDLPAESPLFRLAEVISRHEAFPGNTNVNLARITGDHRVELITFERGAGLTEACGTGAASTAFVGMKTKGLRGEATIALRHGSLLIRTDESETVTMTGPSQRITKGIYYGSDGDH